jgi:CDP-diacylglycerol--serine O-phosphatidyltransferase
MVMLPNGLTLLNLFFGIFALVAAARGDFGRAVLYVMIGALFDAVDGRVARATRSGTRFGEELDSLVDAITFGLAPAMIMYFAVLHKEGWDWIFVFLFSACAVTRLARFNVEQAGRPKIYFHGLPSPAAGGVLASYYWFSQTPLYNQTIIGDLPWHNMLRFLMVGLAYLMVSDVPYPAWPTFSLRTWRGATGLMVFLALALGLVFLPREFFFPVGMLYVAWGIVTAVLRGLLERQPRYADTGGAALDEFMPDGEEPVTNGADFAEVIHRRRGRRRRAHGSPSRPPAGRAPAEEPGE